jgi:hypothetical protein
MCHRYICFLIQWKHDDDPGRGKIFFFPTASRPALGPTQPPIQWVSLGLKRRGLATDYSSPSSSEVKNGGAVLLAPICGHDIVLN